MPITVEMPDGVTLEFPDGTSQDVMKSAIQTKYGKPGMPSFGDVQSGTSRALPYHPMAAFGNKVMGAIGQGLRDIPEMITQAGRNLTGPDDEAAYQKFQQAWTGGQQPSVGDIAQGTLNQVAGAPYDIVVKPAMDVVSPLASGDWETSLRRATPLAALGALHGALSPGEAMEAGPPSAAPSSPGIMSRAADVATNPAVRDVVGVVSPRTARALDWWARRRAAKAAEAAPEAAPEAPSTSQPMTEAERMENIKQQLTPETKGYREAQKAMEKGPPKAEESAKAEEAPSQEPPKERIRAWTDIPLAEEGVKQAETVAEAAAKSGARFDEVYSSPLDRAQETAQKVSGRPPDMISEAFGPAKVGELEGADAAKMKPVLDAMIKDPDLKAPGVGPNSGLPGESIHDFLERFYGGAKRLIDNTAQNPDKQTWLFTHHRNLKAFQALIKSGGDYSKLDIKDIFTNGVGDQPASVHRFYFDEKGQPHLDPINPSDIGDKGGLYVVRHGATEWNAGVKETEMGAKPEVSPPSSPDLATAEAEYRRRVQQIKDNPNLLPEEKGSRLKAEGMRWAATKRQITGNLTPKEEAARQLSLRRIRPGDTVTDAEGNELTVTSSPAFGRVKVKTADGQESLADWNSLTKAEPKAAGYASEGMTPERVGAQLNSLTDAISQGRPLKAEGTGVFQTPNHGTVVADVKGGQVRGAAIVTPQGYLNVIGNAGRPMLRLLAEVEKGNLDFKINPEALTPDAVKFMKVAAQKPKWAQIIQDRLQPAVGE